MGRGWAGFWWAFATVGFFLLLAKYGWDIRTWLGLAFMVWSAIEPTTGKQSKICNGDGSVIRKTTETITAR